MKKIVTFAFALTASLALGAFAYGSDNIKLNINNTEVVSDVAPQVIDGRTMVPVRAIFEGVGAEVKWDSETKTITGNKNGTEVIMTVDSNIASVNGQNITMDCGPVIINNRTLAPARYVAEAFGCTVNWDNDSKTVNIVLPTNEVNTVKTETTTQATTLTTETTTETTTFETTTNPMYSYDTYYKPGTYTIGKDMPEGEYVVFANPERSGYLYNYGKDGNVSDVSGKRYIYNRTFSYCDTLKLNKNTYLDLSNAYAVPLADAKIDQSRGGRYKAGSNFKTGHLTFKLSPKTKVGYVEIGLDGASNKDKTIAYLTEDNESITVNVTNSMYVRYYGCDVYNESLSKIIEYKPIESNYNHTDAKYNMSDVSPVFKKMVDDYLTTLVSEMSPKNMNSTKYLDPAFKKTTADWSSQAKTQADRKYVEVARTMYNHIKTYAHDTLGDVAYSTTIKLNGQEMSGKTYRDILQAEKDYITSLLNEFKSSSTFEGTEVVNTNFAAYRLDVPRLRGTKVN